MDEGLVGLLLGALNSRLKGRQLICGICGGTRHRISGIVALPVQDKLGGGLVIGGKNLPLAPVACEVCGHTIFLNIIALIGKEKVDAEIARQNEASNTLLAVEQHLAEDKKIGG